MLNPVLNTYLACLSITSLLAKFSKQWLLIVFAVGMVTTSAMSYSAEVEALERQAIISQTAQNSFLLNLSRIKGRLIAVGERGLLLLSDDEGDTWQQAAIPVSVTLTSADFSDETNGYAVGHGGCVLMTKDGGETWTLSLDGRQLANTILSAAIDAGDEELVPYAERLVSEGPDKPLLDLLVISANEVVVVGAYGLVLQTDDGGLSWTSLMDRIENPIGLHINSIRKKERRILLAGEQGSVWLSRNEGQSYEVLETPYEGSFFTAELIGTDEIILAGLRGNVWRSTDNGLSWNQIFSPVSATINASLLAADNKLLMVNQAGMVLRMEGDQLVPMSGTPLPSLNSIVELSNGDYLLASPRGLVSLPSADLQ